MTRATSAARAMLLGAAGEILPSLPNSVESAAILIASDRLSSGGKTHNG